MCERPESAIKSMKLYSDVHRIYKDLAELSYNLDDKLKVEDVNKFDHYHYFGTQAIDNAIDGLGISEGSKVIDIGSGLGGAARYMASKTKCIATAIELQPDVHTVAEDLTTRCGLGERVIHQRADFVAEEPEVNKYDHLVSWLVFLHIDDKATLFKKCFESLKPGGNMYIEDYSVLNPLSEADKEVCSELYFSSLLTSEEYTKQIQEAGFVDVTFEDLTKTWCAHVTERQNAFKADKEDRIRIYGEETYEGLIDFYRQIVGLLTGGNVGGCRIKASKPM